MKPLTIAATLATWLIGANGQGFSADEIAAAIEQGKAGKTLQKKCSGKNDNSFDIVAEGPIGRIMRAAREASRKKEAFTPADVTPNMAGDWLSVKATRVEWLRKSDMEPRMPSSPPERQYQTEFYIKSRAPRSEQPIILQPLGSITYDYSNATSYRTTFVNGTASRDMTSRIALPGSDMAASFDLAAFKAIPHKEVEIYVFMTDTGGHGCKISESERKALR